MPQTVAFTKGHGTGNDFVVIPDPDGELDLSDDQVAVALRPPTSASAPTASCAWCARRRIAEGAVPRPPAPSGSWTTATPTDRTPRCAATASACSRATSLDTGLADARTTTPVLIGTRAGVQVRDRAATSASRRPRHAGASSRTTSSCAPAASACRVPASASTSAIRTSSSRSSNADELEALDLTARPAAASRAAARRERRVRRPRRPAGARRRRLHPDARVRTRQSARPSAAARVSRRPRSRCGTGPAQAAPDRWTVEVPGRNARRADAAGPRRLHVLLSGPATLVYSGEVALA